VLELEEELGAGDDFPSFELGEGDRADRGAGLVGERDAAPELENRSSLM
jgi:hypothetical protein